MSSPVFIWSLILHQQYSSFSLRLPYVLSSLDVSSSSTQKFPFRQVFLICRNVQVSICSFIKAFANFNGTENARKYIYIYIYMCVCVCVCVCLFMLLLQLELCEKNMPKEHLLLSS